MTKVSLLCLIFFQCLRNLGNMAEIFWHTLSILGEYDVEMELAEVPYYFPRENEHLVFVCF